MSIPRYWRRRSTLQRGTAGKDDGTVNLRGLCDLLQARLLVPENNRLRSVNEDAILDVVADAAREGEAFAVATEAHEIVGIVVMLHAGDLLLDDRAGVEIRCRVMAGRADELHAALKGAFVRIGPTKAGRKEWWMLMTRASYSLHSHAGSTCMKRASTTSSMSFARRISPTAEMPRPCHC